MRVLGETLLLPERKTKGLPHLACDAFQLRPGDLSPKLSFRVGDGAAILICGLLRFNATATELNLSKSPLGPAVPPVGLASLRSGFHYARFDDLRLSGTSAPGLRSLFALGSLAPHLYRKP